MNKKDDSWMKYERLRKEMVKRQIEARGITDERVVSAMLTIPRHLFVSEALQDQAYGDFPLPIGEQQTISQPYIVAEMTQALNLTGQDRVLEIGTGSGYQTAILSRMVYRVYTIERLHSLLANAQKLFDQLKYYNIVTRYSDGTTGWKEKSPFDAIIVTAGAPEIPTILVDQLTDGGRMVIPVGNQFTQELIRVVKEKDDVQKSNLGGCRFVKLVGEHGWKDS
jgi:protein-L-isoaspartate(D-aspartate) O-methyltransferase